MFRNSFKTLITSALCASLIFASFQCTYAQTKAFEGVQNRIDLSAFDLQLPLAGAKSIKIIKSTDIPNFVSPYFYYNISDKSVRLFTQSNGVTTANSHFPRTELRQVSEWDFVGQHSLKVTMSVISQPNSGKIIIGQIHGDRKGTEAVKIWWNNGNIQVGYKAEFDAKETRITLLKDVKLSDIFNYEINQNGLDIEVKINDKATQFHLGDSWKKETVYFKAGNYLQDNNPPISSGMVAIYKIEVR